MIIKGGSGFLALLDDVAAIAKLAAAQIDEGDLGYWHGSDALGWRQYRGPQPPYAPSVWPYELTTSIASKAHPAVSWPLTAFLDAVF